MHHKINSFIFLLKYVQYYYAKSMIATCQVKFSTFKHGYLMQMCRSSDSRVRFHKHICDASERINGAYLKPAMPRAPRQVLLP